MYTINEIEAEYLKMNNSGDYDIKISARDLIDHIKYLQKTNKIIDKTAVINNLYYLELKIGPLTEIEYKEKISQLKSLGFK